MTSMAAPDAPATSTARDTLLEVAGLCTQFATPSGPLHAVRNVDLRIRRGQRLAIVGESGSGKSALAMSIMGLVPSPGKVVAGSIRLDGQELIGLSDKRLSRIRGRRIALVFQDPMSALDPIRTVGGQLVETIRTHQPVSKSAARKQATDLLGEVGVVNPAARLGDYPHQYSGGMRQRVLIAMALANDPDLVIADEPTTALDVTTQAQVLELLTRMVADREAALLMITHNLGVVAGYCDEVKVMYAGEIVEEAPSASLFRHASHPYTRELLKCVVRPDRRHAGLLATIPGTLPDLTRPLAGCAFEPRCPLGHDVAICRTEAPPVVHLATGAATTIVRCHFAGTHKEEVE